MLGQIVEIEGAGRRLSLERGFLTVTGPDGPLGTVPLDDIEAVILSNPAASLTSQAISALAARGAPLVICGTDFRPAAYLLPVSGHHAQGDRMEGQAAAALPVKKRIWSEIVRAKIRAQAAALDRHAINPLPINVLADRSAPATRTTWRPAQPSAIFRRCSAATSSAHAATASTHF